MLTSIGTVPLVIAAVVVFVLVFGLVLLVGLVLSGRKRPEPVRSFAPAAVLDTKPSPVVAGLAAEVEEVERQMSTAVGMLSRLQKWQGWMSPVQGSTDASAEAAAVAARK